MATLVLQPTDAMELHRRCFKGDNDMLVDRLIAASTRKEVSHDSLVERTLVPFFDSSDASAATYQALQPSRRGPASKPVPVPAGGAHAHGLKRGAHERSATHLAGSPPRKDAEVVQAKHPRRGGKALAQPATSGSSTASACSSLSSVRHSGSGSDTEMTSPASVQHPRKPRSSCKKHHRDVAAPVASATPKPAAGSQRQSPPRKRPEPAVVDMRLLAAASAAVGPALRTPGKATATRAITAPTPAKYAGPAFTNSPTPDCLPIPTSSLLLAQAADSLRSRLTL